MGVKRVGTTKTIVSSPKVKRGAKPAINALALPTQAKAMNTDFFAYTTMVYGRPGIGKTTFMSSFPSSIFFSCERVSEGISCFDFNSDNGGVYDWDIFREGVKLLKKTKKFKTVCIDGISAAYAMCLDWVCNDLDIPYPRDNDFGKSWRAVKNEFIEQLIILRKTGRKLAFSCHADEKQIVTHSGEKFTVIQPLLSGGAYRVMKEITDFVLYVDFVKIDGKSERVIFTTGDEVIDAKHAELGNGTFPKYLPLNHENGAKVLADGFKGVDVGIDPATIKADKRTSKSVEAAIKKEEITRKRERVRGTGADRKKTKKK